MSNSGDKILIGNCSGFYGDRLSAAKDMVEGGPIDVLTGDYLAELTMTILYNQKMKRGEDQGYVGTFLKQFKDVAKSCQERNIKIVTNAGGLNPSSMANKVEEITQELNLDLKDKTVGICAGASTPPWLIKQTIDEVLHERYN